MNMFAMCQTEICACVRVRVYYQYGEHKVASQCKIVVLCDSIRMTFSYEWAAAHL